MEERKRIVIIGAGFAGLDAAHELAHAPVDILLIDRHNYHTFTPLLYQVATSGLDPSSIAYPVRSIFRKQRNIQFMLGTVTAIQTASRTITVKTESDLREEHYDALLVAVGSVTNYFSPAIEQHSFGLKDLNDAIALRQHILQLFERARWTDDEDRRIALTTFVVVGGGATGIETAGALFELYNHVLTAEYESGRPKMQAKVMLLEATDRLLAPYPEHLRQQAVKQLESIGVEVMLQAAVDRVEADQVVMKDGRTIATHTLVWAAGVRAAPLAEMLKVPLEKGGRLPVLPTLEVIGIPQVYAAGDLAHLADPEGNPYPMVIQVAKQQGKLAAKNMLAAFSQQPQQAFHYRDLGIMATIGRRRAVAWIFNRIQLSGLLAWFAWLFLHLVTLMGFRNRITVFINWVWNYLTYDRSVRIILDNQQPEPSREVTEKVVA